MGHCSNMWVKWTPNKHTKLTLLRTILLLLLQGFKLAISWSWVHHSFQQAVLAALTVLWIRCHYWCNITQTENAGGKISHCPFARTLRIERVEKRRRRKTRGWSCHGMLCLGSFQLASWWLIAEKLRLISVLACHWGQEFNIANAQRCINGVIALCSRLNPMSSGLRLFRITSVAHYSSMYFLVHLSGKGTTAHICWYLPF